VSEWREYRELREIEQALNEANDRLNSIEAAVADQSAKIDQLLAVLIPPQDEVTDFQLFQISGGNMAIQGTQQGTTSTFVIGLVPATNFVPLTSGPVVTVDDTLVTLGPVDPKTLQFTASVAATDTGASYNLTISGVNGAGTAISHVFNVPILAAAPVQVTDFSLSQVTAPPA